MTSRSLLGGAALLAVAACGGSDGGPTATFDGEECDYDGPSEVAEEHIDVTFRNHSGDVAALAFLFLADESALEEEAASIGSRVDVAGQNPSGPTELSGVLQADAGEDAMQTAPLRPGTYLLDCVTFEGGAPEEVWRVAVLEVG